MTSTTGGKRPLQDADVSHRPGSGRRNKRPRKYIEESKALPGAYLSRDLANLNSGVRAHYFQAGEDTCQQRNRNKKDQGNAPKKSKKYPSGTTVRLVPLAHASRRQRYFEPWVTNTYGRNVEARVIENCASLTNHWTILLLSIMFILMMDYVLT